MFLRARVFGVTLARSGPRLRELPGACRGCRGLAKGPLPSLSPCVRHDSPSWNLLSSLSVWNEERHSAGGRIQPCWEPTGSKFPYSLATLANGERKTIAAIHVGIARKAQLNKTCVI